MSTTIAPVATRVTAADALLREYFIIRAVVASRDATCLDLEVGAAIVKDGVVIAEGYNDSPPGLISCKDAGECDLHEGACERTIHAEHNAIINAAEQDLNGASIYVTDRPCLGCAARIVEAGITHVYFVRPYLKGAAESLALMAEHGITVQQHPMPLDEHGTIAL